MITRCRAVGMCEITALGDFQGLWEERETASCFPPFPSGRHFHRFGWGECFFVIGPVQLTRTFLIPTLCAIDHDLRCPLDFLLSLDDLECMTKALVLNGCSMADALVFAQDAIGKQVPLPAHLKRSICEVVDLNVLAGELVS
jgi:hypothetical protein